MGDHISTLPAQVTEVFKLAARDQENVEKTGQGPISDCYRDHPLNRGFYYEPVYSGAHIS